MEKTLITKEERDLFKKYLTVEDYKKIEAHTNQKQSSVYSIVNRRKKVNEGTKCIVDACYVAVYAKMIEEAKFIKANINKVRELKSVKKYIKLNKSDKWI